MSPVGRCLPGDGSVGGQARGAQVVAPTREDPFARWASAVLGGPAGSRLALPSHPWWTPARVLAVVAVVTTALAVVRNQHCRARGWTTPGQFVHTCYSDVAVLWGTLGGSPAAVVGLDPATPDALAQPALTVWVAALLGVLVAPLAPTAQLLAGGDADALTTGSRVFFDLWAVVGAGALVVAVLAVVSLSGRRPWDATLVAVSPVVVLSGLVSFDLLGVALGVAAAAVWARRRPVLAGVLLGLAVAARFHVVLLALALLLLAVRAARVREVAVTCACAAGVWAAVNLPLAVLAPQAWRAPVRAWWAAEPGYGSLLLLPRLLADEQVAGVRGLSGTESSVVSLVLGAVVLVGVGTWVLRSPVVPRLPVLVLVLIVLTLLVSKTVPVQASLWLLPWAALAVPGWRDHLWWWAAEALYVVAVWQFLVGLSEAGRALPSGFYAFLLLTRLLSWAWLARQAWCTTRHPGLDPVRREADGGDPAAGVLRGGSDSRTGPRPDRRPAAAVRQGA